MMIPSPNHNVSFWNAGIPHIRKSNIQKSEPQKNFLSIVSLLSKRLYSVFKRIQPKINLF